MESIEILQEKINNHSLRVKVLLDLLDIEYAQLDVLHEKVMFFHYEDIKKTLDNVNSIKLDKNIYNFMLSCDGISNNRKFINMERKIKSILNHFHGIKIHCFNNLYIPVIDFSVLKNTHDIIHTYEKALKYIDGTTSYDRFDNIVPVILQSDKQYLFFKHNNHYVISIDNVYQIFDNNDTLYNDISNFSYSSLLKTDDSEDDIEFIK